MKKHYLASVSAYGQEGYMKFKRFTRLLSFIRKFPASLPILYEGNFAWVGLVYKQKNGKLAIKFK